MIYEREERPLKEVYSDLLVEYGRKDPRIVIVEADLMKSGSTDKFQQEFPDRTFDVGVAEANMICVAAGLSLMGKIPFTHTFAVFASRRCCDQINQSVAYAGCNVKMCGSDPGITTELNGGTHMAMDDVGIMRSIPEMTIFEPVDSRQLRAVFPQILNLETPVYIRLFRPNATRIFTGEETDYRLGKGIVLREGSDVTILSSGIMVAEALKAAELLDTGGDNQHPYNKAFGYQAYYRERSKDRMCGDCGKWEYLQWTWQRCSGMPGGAPAKTDETDRSAGLFRTDWPCGGTFECISHGSRRYCRGRSRTGKKQGKGRIVICLFQ